MAAPPSDRDLKVKRIVLPDGKTIEVVYFEEAIGSEMTAKRPLDEAPEADTATDGLHVCPECRSHLVYPIGWTEAARRRWRVTLRCPECEWSHAGIFAQEDLDRFDEELDRGSGALMSDLRQLVRANMAEEIDRFVAALEAGAILPSDF